MTTHEDHMREAIKMADAAAKKGNGPFGAVLVKDGEIVLSAQNTVNTSNDITAHAEMNLVRMAWAKYDRDFLSECTVYTSTEPCPMCAGAIYWSGVYRVVFGCSWEKLAEYTDGSTNISAADVLAEAGRHVEFIGPIIEAEAVTSHAGFWEDHKGEAL